MDVLGRELSGKDDRSGRFGLYAEPYVLSFKRVLRASKSVYRCLPKAEVPDVAADALKAPAEVSKGNTANRECNRKKERGRNECARQHGKKRGHPEMKWVTDKSIPNPGLRAQPRAGNELRQAVRRFVRIG